MQENADLKEKIQDLEHTVSQLQFETETIVDYINRYQIEREKLGKKHALKDETIRSLSTQLQVNKLALQEINNYFAAYIRVSATTSASTLAPEEENELNKKKTFILIQAQSLLNELLSTSATTLQNSMSSNASSSSSTSSPSNSDQLNSIGKNNVNKLNNHHQRHQQLSSEPVIDSNSIQAFKSILNVCPSCHGDLFVV